MEHYTKPAPLTFVATIQKLYRYYYYLLALKKAFKDPFFKDRFSKLLQSVFLDYSKILIF